MAKPNLEQKDARSLLWEVYDLEVDSIESLPSYDDQNMLIHLKDGSKVVLKVAASNAECRK